jgi:predicted aspartyl protease
MKPLATRRTFIARMLGAASLCRAAELSLPVTRTKTKLAVVPVLVGETRLNFVADTGAANSLIALEALTRLAPGDFESRGVASQGFAGGQAIAQRIALRSLAVAPGQGVALDVNAVAMSPLRDQFGADIDGVLGMEILGRYTLRLDFRRQRIDLLPPKAAIGKKSLSFDYNREREILFPVQLDGHAVTALLDTGAAQTGVNWNAARQSGIGRNTPGLSERITIVGGDSNRWTVHEYQFSTMQIASMHWNRPTLVIADVPAFTSLQLSTKPGAIIGMDFWDNRVITISFTRHRLTIQ